MWHDILMAIGLMLVIEGILPFLNPGWVRRMLLEMTRQEDRFLRVGGLVSMLIGLGVLYLAR